MPEKLSLLIPFYNEEESLPHLLQVLLKVQWTTPVELVFVNDCSKDHSASVLRNWLLKNSAELDTRGMTYQFHEHAVNQGKGTGIHTAIQHATGTVMIVQDADTEYDPNEIPSLIQPILDKKADVVYGSRYRKNGGQTHRTYHFLINQLLTFLSNLFSGLYLTDMETCYKAFRHDIIKNICLKSRRFGFEPEVTAHLARLKVRVWEIPINYFPRSFLEGKKITWKDGVAALWHILYFNLIFPNKHRFRPQLPQKYVFKKWSDRYTGHSGLLKETDERAKHL